MDGRRSASFGTPVARIARDNIRSLPLRLSGRSRSRMSSRLIGPPDPRRRCTARIAPAASPEADAVTGNAPASQTQAPQCCEDADIAGRPARRPRRALRARGEVPHNARTVRCNLRCGWARTLLLRLCRRRPGISMDRRGAPTHQDVSDDSSLRRPSIRTDGNLTKFFRKLIGTLRSPQSTIQRP